MELGIYGILLHTYLTIALNRDNHRPCQINASVTEFPQLKRDPNHKKDNNTASGLVSPHSWRTSFPTTHAQTTTISEAQNYKLSIPNVTWKLLYFIMMQIPFPLHWYSLFDNIK